MAARQERADRRPVPRFRRFPDERDPPVVVSRTSPEPEWVSVLRTCWRASSPADQQKALRWLRRAQEQAEVEGCLRGLQKGLRAIQVGEMHIVSLILIEHLALVAVGRVDSVRDIARQVYEVLESLQTAGSGGTE